MFPRPYTHFCSDTQLGESIYLHFLDYKISCILQGEKNLKSPQFTVHNKIWLFYHCLQIPGDFFWSVTYSSYNFFDT